MPYRCRVHYATSSISFAPPRPPPLRRVRATSRGPVCGPVPTGLPVPSAAAIPLPAAAARRSPRRDPQPCRRGPAMPPPGLDQAPERVCIKLLAGSGPAGNRATGSGITQSIAAPSAAEFYRRGNDMYFAHSVRTAMICSGMTAFRAPPPADRSGLGASDVALSSTAGA